MSKFIQVHRKTIEKGNKKTYRQLVNLANVITVSEDDDKCIIKTFDGEFAPIENYDQVALLIGACVGGIPLPALEDTIKSMD